MFNGFSSIGELVVKPSAIRDSDPKQADYDEKVMDSCGGILQYREEDMPLTQFMKQYKPSEIHR